MNEPSNNASESAASKPNASDAQISAPAPPRRRTASASAPMLAGMMLAVGEIIEPEKTHVELHAEAAEPVDNDFDLDFGVLPPLS